MKNKDKYEKWIKEMFDKYRSVLFLEKYRLEIEYSDEKGAPMLATDCNYPYLDIVITYTDKALNDFLKNKKRSERWIVHEFCHIVTDSFYSTVVRWPTKQAIEDARERLTDHIAQIVNLHIAKN